MRKAFVRSILSDFERLQDSKGPSLVQQLYAADSNDRRHSHSWARDYLYRGNISDPELDDCFGSDDGEQHQAWFLALLARGNAGNIIWYFQERWEKIPVGERQAVGTIILAGNVVRTSNWPRTIEQIGVVMSLLTAGVSPNLRYTWMCPGPVNFSKRRASMSLWEAYIECFPNIWRESDALVNRALNVMRLLLDEGNANTHCQLPAGHNSFLSAIKYESREKAGEHGLEHRQRSWSRHSRELFTMLAERGLLTCEERREAVEGGYVDAASSNAQLTQQACEPFVRRPFSSRARRIVDKVRQ